MNKKIFVVGYDNQIRRLVRKNRMWYSVNINNKELNRIYTPLIESLKYRVYDWVITTTPSYYYGLRENQGENEFYRESSTLEQINQYQKLHSILNEIQLV